MPRYHVIEPLKHDGDRYTPGDIMEMSVKDSNPLLVAGAIEPAPEQQQINPIAPNTPPESDEGADEPEAHAEEASAPVATETVAPPKAPRKRSR